MEYSTTQANNIAIFAGLLALILPKFGVNIGSEELSSWLGLGVAFIGTLLQWIHRQKKGDLTLGGFKK